MIASVADAILAVLLAPQCAACRIPLEQPTRGSVCPRCWASIQPLTEPLCDVCGDRAEASSRQCVRCARTPRVISRGRAVAAYDGTLREILHALKYNNRPSLAAPLSRLMALHGRTIILGADFAVPVPLHFLRRHSRGFNQAEELARHLPLRLLRALRRTRATATQTDLPEEARHGNVRDAFAVRWRARRLLAGATVVVVDDVSTTGATLDACARVLLAAGAKEVRALTAARAVSQQR